ncbi:hypothetical protein HAX54_009833, partial [Datura stramonium]|nr:hypothetical protein [Datura stramonium]
ASRGLGGSREANIRPTTQPRPRFSVRSAGATRCVTPRQTCPRPNGFGRNLRSKTRWFTRFCISHQVSHFATFFIDARAEISIAESRFGLKRSTGPPARIADGAREAGYQLSIPWRFSRLGSLITRHAREHVPRTGGRRTEEGRSTPHARLPKCLNRFTGRSALQVSTMILPQ